MVMAGLAIASSAAGYVSQEQAADAQDAANARAERNIITKRNFDYEAIAAQGSEDRRAAAIDKENVARQAARDRATALVSAGEGGLQISSNSVEALVRDLNAQQSRFNAQTDDNVIRGDLQRDRQRQAAGLNAQTALDNLIPAQRPSLLAAGLKAGQGVFGAYQEHLKLKKDTPDLGNGFTGKNPFKTPYVAGGA